MVWIPIAAWAAAVLVAAVVLGFCAYEISWKSKRLRADMAKLQSLGDDMAELRSGFAAVQERLAATGLR